jgi:hypothetical protein
VSSRLGPQSTGAPGRTLSKNTCSFIALPLLPSIVIDDVLLEVLRLRRVKRRERALDLCQELLPVCKRVAEAVEHEFCPEV